MNKKITNNLLIEYRNSMRFKLIVFIIVILCTKLLVMQKKKQQIKKAHHPCIKNSRCHWCHEQNDNTQNNKIISIVYRSLINKYLNALYGGSPSLQIDYFFHTMFRMYSGGVSQFQKQFLQISQFFNVYYQIGRTKIRITELVKKQSRKTIKPNMHFYGPVFHILRKCRVSKQKCLKIEPKQNKNKPSPLDMFNDSFMYSAKTAQSAQQQKKKVKQKNIKNMNQSILQMKKLCKSIGIMFSKIQTEKSKKKLKQHPEYFPKKSFRQLQMDIPKQMKQYQRSKQKQFKEHLQTNFSIIENETGYDDHKFRNSDKKVVQKQRQTHKYSLRDNQHRSKIKTSNQKSKLIQNARFKKTQDFYDVKSKNSSKKSKCLQYSPKGSIKNYNIQSKPYSVKRSSTQRIQLISDSPIIPPAYYTKQVHHTEIGGIIKARKNKLKEKKQKRIHYYSPNFSSKMINEANNIKRSGKIKQSKSLKQLITIYERKSDDRSKSKPILSHKNPDYNFNSQKRSSNKFN